MPRKSVRPPDLGTLPFTVMFNSKAGQQTCWPCGTPGTHTVGEGATAKIVPVYSPTVQFENHTYVTSVREIARGLVLAEQFSQPWGWWLDPNTLPEEYREVFRKCNRIGKVEVALSAFDKVPIEEVLENLEPSDYEPQPPTEEKGIPDVSLNCPVPGCNLTFTAKKEGTFDKVQAAIVNHVRVMHSDWTGGTGLPT